jgi:hypothetical protein
MPGALFPDDCLRAQKWFRQRPMVSSGRRGVVTVCLPDDRHLRARSACCGGVTDEKPRPAGQQQGGANQEYQAALNLPLAATQSPLLIVAKP